MIVWHWTCFLWMNMWSNIMAPSAITLAAVAFSHLKLKAHQHQLHEKQMKALDGNRDA